MSLSSYCKCYSTRLSDTELLAKAQSMEARAPLPPPGPGMPGNLMGQGVGNLMQQQQEMGAGQYMGEAGRFQGGRSGWEEERCIGSFQPGGGDKARLSKIHLNIGLPIPFKEASVPVGTAI